MDLVKVSISTKQIKPFEYFTPYHVVRFMESYKGTQDEFLGIIYDLVDRGREKNV